MEGDYFDFELYAEDYSNSNYLSINIYGGYSSNSSGTDLTLRDAVNCQTVFHTATTPLYHFIYNIPYTAIYINIGYLSSNALNTIDGIVLDGYDARYDVSAIWACGSPAYISNCEIYGFGHYVSQGSSGTPSSLTYSYLLWLEHYHLDDYSTIIDCEIHDNIAKVLITHVGNFWIENTAIYDNDLETNFIWTQNGGDLIEINNELY